MSTQPDGSAIATDRLLSRDDLRYWSPGPVPGSVWAINGAGEPVLRGNVPAAVRARAADVAEARRDENARVVYAGGQLFGIEHLGPRFEHWITPLDVAQPAGAARQILAELAANGISVTYGGRP